MSIRLAVLNREPEAISLAHYKKHLMRELETLGVTLIPFNVGEPVPAACDVVWDPGMGRNRLPSSAFKGMDVPIVVTLHGSANFTMSWWEAYSSFTEAALDKFNNIQAMQTWKWFRNKVARVIAVSYYGADEATRVYGLSDSIVTPIYHGVDHKIFFPQKSLSQTEDYFLHVSAYQPKKNIDRLIAAYSRLPQNSRPKLVVIAPGYNPKKKTKLIPGLTIHSYAHDPAELAKLYSNALAFVFPSLHETFGLPIVEAMACGCPVITSHNTACAEVAANSALLVDPRTTKDIANAMSRIMLEPELREYLRQEGLVRARQFTWKQSAFRHLEIFKSSISA